MSLLLQPTVSSPSAMVERAPMVSAKEQSPLSLSSTHLLSSSSLERRSLTRGMVEVAMRGEEGMFLDLGLMEVVLLECHFMEPPPRLVLIGGVLLLSLTRN